MLGDCQYDSQQWGEVLLSNTTTLEWVSLAWVILVVPHLTALSRGAGPVLGRAGQVEGIPADGVLQNVDLHHLQAPYLISTNHPSVKQVLGISTNAINSMACPSTLTPGIKWQEQPLQSWL